MSRATLRVRMGVTAASVIVGFGIAAAPAVAATTSANGPTWSRAHSEPRFELATKAPTASPASSKAARRRAEARRAHVRRVRLVHRHNAKVRRVLHEASRQKGKPYVYGAAGPRAFDCSGLVRFVFMHAVHRSLPHNAAEQFHSLHHIGRRALRPGDLIFTDNGYISHVGIFAGHDHWWVAPHTGTHVQLQRIYHAHFVYARVLVYHRR
jgi:cell wall-associated NlpC family hydrolase